MTRKDKQDRLITLQERAAFGDITQEEAVEIEKLSEYLDDPATDSQVDYIETLLGKLCADLSDYTDTELEDLTGSEASDLIDELKDDVTDAGAWED